MIFEGYPKEQLEKIAKDFQYNRGMPRNITIPEIMSILEDAANVGYNCACIDHEED